MLAGLGIARAADDKPRTGPAPAWVKPIALEPAAPLAAGEQLSQGVRYLLSDEQVRVEGSTRQRFRHLAMQAVNEKGVEQIANIEIGYDPSYLTLTLHAVNIRRGDKLISKLAAANVRVLQREKELDALIYDGSKTAHIFLDDVRVGDIVEYAYSVRGANPVFGGRMFGQFDLQWVVPVQRNYLRLLWPAGRELTITPRNTQLQPRKSTATAGFIDHEWDQHAVPGRPGNSETPGWFDAYPFVQWSEFKSWAAVAQWAVPLYRTPTALSGELQAEVQRIARQIPADRPEDRLVAALNFVQKQVRYMGVEVGAGSHAPSPPATVLARRFGDCKDKTLLTLTMLRALGVEARAALVHTQVRRGLRELAPTPARFNHVLVMARIKGRDYFVDPTSAPQYGSLDLISQAGFDVALLVDERTQDLSMMPESAATLNLRNVHAEIDASAGIDKPVHYTVITALQGLSAESARSMLDGQTAQELQKTYLNFYNRSYPGLTVERPFEVKDDRAANHMTITEHYLIKDFWVDSAENKRLEAHIRVPEIKSYLQTPHDTVRHEPLAVPHPREIEHVTVVHLPDRWTIKAETTRVSDPAFELERRVEGGGRLVTLTDHYRSLADHVDPAAIAAYVKHVEEADDALGYLLYTGRKAGLASPAPASAPATTTTAKTTTASTTKSADDDEGWAVQFNWTIALLALMFTGLWLWLAGKAWRWEPHGERATAERDAQPIDGLLLLVGLGLLITPFWLGHDFAPGLTAYGNASWMDLSTRGGASYHPLMAPLLLGELAVILAQLVFSVLLLALFFKRRRSLPRAYIIFGWGSLLLVVLDHLATRAVPSLAASAGTGAIGPMVRQLLSLTLWTAYFLKSDRVQRTFVKTRQAPVAALPSKVDPLPAAPLQATAAE